MALRRQKNLFIVAGLVMLLVVIVALVSTFWPSNEQKFFELGLLGKNHIADNFFTNNNSTLDTGSQVNWFIFVHNNVGSASYIYVKVKLLNSTMTQPNDLENTPSPSAVLLEIPSSLAPNETVLLPFSCNINDAVSQNGTTIIRQLIVNNQTIDVNVLSSDYFYVVFELWVYNQTSHNYEFGWYSGKNFVSTSVNIAFQVKTP